MCTSDKNPWPAIPVSLLNFICEKNDSYLPYIVDPRISFEFNSLFTQQCHQKKMFILQECNIMEYLICFLGTSESRRHSADKEPFLHAHKPNEPSNRKANRRKKKEDRESTPRSQKLKGGKINSREHAEIMLSRYARSNLRDTLRPLESTTTRASYSSQRRISLREQKAKKRIFFLAPFIRCPHPCSLLNSACFGGHEHKK